MLHGDQFSVSQAVLPAKGWAHLLAQHCEAMHQRYASNQGERGLRYDLYISIKTLKTYSYKCTRKLKFMY